MRRSNIKETSAMSMDIIKINRDIHGAKVEPREFANRSRAAVIV